MSTFPFNRFPFRLLLFSFYLSFSSLISLPCKQIGAGPNSLESLFKAVTKFGKLKSLELSGNSLILKKKKADKSTASGLYSSHLSSLQKAASDSLESMLNCLPLTSSSSVSSSVNKTKQKQKKLKGDKSAVVDKKKKTNTPVRKSKGERVKIANELNIAERNRRRLLSHLADLLIASEELQELSLIKVGLDDDAVKYVKRVMEKKLQSKTEMEGRGVKETGIVGARESHGENGRRPSRVVHLELNSLSAESVLY